MAYYNNIDSLRESLVSNIQSALEDETTKHMRTVLADIISKNVYKRYKPIYYQRRYKSGGLLSKHLMQSTNKRTKTIAKIYFTTKARGNPDKYFTEQEGFLKRIEYGNSNPYFGSTSDAYNKPRPFMSKIKSRSVNTLIITPLRKGLKNRGIQTFK